MFKRKIHWRLLWLLVLVLPMASCREGRIDADGFAGRTDPKKTGFGYFFFFGNAASDGAPELRAVVRRTAEATERVSASDFSVVLETYTEDRYRLFNSYLLVLDEKFAGIQLIEKPAQATFVLGPICRSTDSSQTPFELAILVNGDQSRNAAIYSGQSAMQQIPVTKTGESELAYSSDVFESQPKEGSSKPDGRGVRRLILGEEAGTTHEITFTSNAYGVKNLTCLIPAQLP